MLRWRPIKNATANKTPGHAALLPSVQHVDGHGSPAAPLSELRFAVLTSLIIMLSYLTVLKVSSLDRVLSYVGSTGSTTISFILPGLFYYKISDPESPHHQRLAKDDDLEDEEPQDDELRESVASLGSTVGSPPRPRWRWRRRWRWDLEHLETGLLRRLALCLAVYGFCVMATCLIVNTFFVTSEGH